MRQEEGLQGRKGVGGGGLELKSEDFVDADIAATTEWDFHSLGELPISSKMLHFNVRLFPRFCIRTCGINI